MHPRAAGGFGSGKLGLYEAPFGIGEVGLVCSSHTRYFTELPPQTTFSDSFKAKFAEDPFRALRSARATKVQKGLELAANTTLCHASSRMERRRPPRGGKAKEPKIGEPRRWRNFGPITYPVHPQSLCLWRKR